MSCKILTAKLLKAEFLLSVHMHLSPLASPTLHTLAKPNRKKLS